jgi:hypothetical protein
MRANSLFGLMCVLTLGVCLVFPATAEQPGDKLLEVFEKDIAPEESLICMPR